jgi:hypothetical protein
VAAEAAVGRHHARQAGSRTMGWPALQPTSLNSGMLLTLPMTRNRPGEWGSVWAS